MDLFHYLVFLNTSLFTRETYIFKDKLRWEQKFPLWSYIIQVLTSFEVFLSFRVHNADKNERQIQSIGETTAKSLENENKEVDNAEGMCSTDSVSIVEMIQTEILMTLWVFNLEKYFLNRMKLFRYKNLQQPKLHKRIW